jgi:signal recognition particle subunit SRP54
MDPAQLKAAADLAKGKMPTGLPGLGGGGLKLPSGLSGLGGFGKKK